MKLRKKADKLKHIDEEIGFLKGRIALWDTFETTALVNGEPVAEVAKKEYADWIQTLEKVKEDLPDE